MFADAEQRLMAAIALQIKAGLDAGTDPVKAIQLGVLKRQAQQLVAALKAATPQMLAHLMTTATDMGTAAALTELSAMAGVPDTAVTGALGGAQAARLATADLTNTFNDVTKRILRVPQDIYRKAVGQSVTDSLLGLGTNRQSQAKAWQRLISVGVKGFEDKSGRQWNLATYTEMATRTAARRAWEEQHVATMEQHGITLVSIVVGSDACKKCADWSGKILRTDAGPTGRIQVDSAVGTGKVTVNVEGTIPQATGKGWHHPNCRCSSVAYMPGLSIVEDATHYDPQAEADREHLRLLERTIRAEKMDMAAAIDPLQVTDGRKKIRALQAEIAAHVKRTGLIRQRHREQVNLGNAGPA
jgi:hypothetical protein